MSCDSFLNLFKMVMKISANVKHTYTNIKGNSVVKNVLYQKKGDSMNYKIIRIFIIIGILLTRYAHTNINDACPCSLDITGGCQCMAKSQILKLQTVHHGAPVRAVGWLCDPKCFLHRTYGLAAIGGFLSDFNAGPYGASVRLYEFNLLTEQFIELDAVAPTPYVFALDICCIDSEAYLAVAGMPNHTTGHDVWIYKFNSSTKKLELITSFTHGNTVYAIKWLCSECSEYLTNRFLAIGGEAAPDNADIRLLSFDPENQTLTIVNSRTHGATVFALDWCKRDGVRPLLAVGGKTAREDCEKINLRIFSTDCVGSMNLINRGTYFEGKTVRTLSWCCSNLPCPTFPYTLAVGGDPDCDEHTHHRNRDNLQIYALRIADCGLIPIPGLSHHQPGRVFALDWIPNTNCANLTVGGGCDKCGHCKNNIFSYKIVIDKTQQSFSLSLVSASKFDEVVTSLSWCFAGNCSYLLVGTENPFWTDPRKNILCKNPDEIVLYKGSFAKHLEAPRPLCLRKFEFED